MREREPRRGEDERHHPGPAVQVHTQICDANSSVSPSLPFVLTHTSYVACLSPSLCIRIRCLGSINLNSSLFLSPTRTPPAAPPPQESQPPPLHVCLPFRTRNNQSERASETEWGGGTWLKLRTNKRGGGCSVAARSLEKKKKRRQSKGGRAPPSCHTTGPRYSLLAGLPKCVAECENHETFRNNFCVAPSIGWLLGWLSGWSGDCVGPRGRSFTRTITVAPLPPS